MASPALLPPAVNKIPDLLQRSSILPKRRAPVSGAPTRTRFAKPRPNIGALVNKTTKEVPLPEQEKIPTQQEEISKVSEVSKESTAASTTTVEPIDENLSASKIEEELSTSCERTPEKIVDEVPPPNLQSSPISEKEPLIDPPPSIEILEKTPPRCKSVNEVAHEKEITTVAITKTPDYPTLKSILNSPRKRLTTKKSHERKKRFANGTEAPPRSEMTMTDLIYFNPSGSPMKSKKPPANVEEEPLPSDENAAPLEPIEDEENDDSIMHSAPKVIINDNGEIIIDESSLVIRRKETVDHSIAAVVENDNTTYSSFRKKTSKQWTNKETAKFYKALSLVGTDFALMQNIFTVDGKLTRTRRELKLKFKREERQNTELVHQAMYETQTYDISILDDDPDDVVDTSEIKNEPKKTKRGLKSDKSTKTKNESQEEQTASTENTATNYPIDEIYNENESQEELTVSAENATVNYLIGETENESREKQAISVESTTNYQTDKNKDESQEQQTISVEDTTLHQAFDKNKDESQEQQTISVEGTTLHQAFDKNKNGSREQLAISVEDTTNYGAFDKTKNKGREKRVVFIEDTKNYRTDKTNINESKEQSVSIKNTTENYQTDPVVNLKTQRKTKGENIAHTSNFLDLVPCYENQCVPCDEKQLRVQPVPAKNFYYSFDGNDTVKAPGRSKRIRKAKVLSDFVTDDTDSDSYEMTEEEDLPCTKKIICKNRSNKKDEEFKLPNVDNAVINKDLLDRLPLKNEKHTYSRSNGWKTTTEQKTHESLDVVCLPVKNITNMVQIPDAYYKNGSSDNYLTDAAISEVVISNVSTRRGKRKAAPNIGRGTKRLAETKPQQTRNPSFSNFTPAQVSVMPPKYTYSKQRSNQNVSLTPITLGYQVNDQTAEQQTPYYTAEVPNNFTIPLKERASERAFQVEPQMEVEFTSQRTPQPSLKSHAVSPQIQLEEPKTVSAYNGDQSPVMIFTKSSNNENILHLFVVKNPADDS